MFGGGVMTRYLASILGSIIGSNSNVPFSSILAALGGDWLVGVLKAYKFGSPTRRKILESISRDTSLQEELAKKLTKAQKEFVDREIEREAIRVNAKVRQVKERLVKEITDVPRLGPGPGEQSAKVVNLEPIMVAPKDSKPEFTGGGLIADSRSGVETKLETPRGADEVKSISNTIDDLSESIKKAKASGKSFDEWVKGQGEQSYRSTHQVDTKTASPITKIDDGMLNSFVDEFKRQYGYPAL
jgi:hypothetical protein